MRVITLILLTALTVTVSAEEPKSAPLVAEVMRVASDPPKEFVLANGQHSIELEVPAGNGPVFWEKCTEADCAFYPKENRAVVVPPGVAGRYYFTASTGGKATHFVVVVGVPTPMPPKPVEPPVNPPAPPVNPLTLRFQAAYTADTGTDKANDLADLVELFNQAQTYADDASVTTVKALAGKVAAAAKSLIGEKDFVGMKAIVNAELKALFPADAPLTPALRKDAAAKFKVIHEALKGVK